MATPEQTYLDIVNELEFACVNAPNKLVQRAVVRAMRKIAKETCLLETTLKPQVQDYVAEYDYGRLLPEGFKVDRVLRVKWCGDCITAIDPCACHPCGFEPINKSCLRMHPTPCGNALDALEVTVSVMPDYDLCSIPQELADESELVQELATAELQGMSKQAWSDRDGARSAGRSARARLIQLRREVNEGFAPSEEYDHRSQAL